MPRLLFVDNDRKMCEVMKEYLSWNGFEVAVLNSNAQVLDELLNNEYDLLLYNIIMERGGFELCRKLRNSDSPKLSRTGILIFTPEPLEFEDYITLRQLELYFIDKYADIEEWINKISLILRKIRE
ncbi:MAG: response regulator [Candidatus Omnitrophica bacterium]|nr:response regulator [Candidatus Omnitrophota bacterium]MDD5653486.1 response regulator [Candidatus Omnitrophota bacterium]